MCIRDSGNALVELGKAHEDVVVLDADLAAATKLSLIHILAQLKEEAQMIDNDTLIRYIRIFSDLTNQLKYATQKRVLLEVTLIKLCRPAMDQNLSLIHILGKRGGNVSDFYRPVL